MAKKNEQLNEVSALNALFKKIPNNVFHENEAKARWIKNFVGSSLTFFRFCTCWLTISFVFWPAVLLSNSWSSFLYRLSKLMTGKVFVKAQSNPQIPKLGPVASSRSVNQSMFVPVSKKSRKFTSAKL